MVMGVYFDIIKERKEYSGQYSVWLNERVAGGSYLSETVTPTEWRIGENFAGTLHEGVVFTRLDGVDAPL